MIKKQDKSTFRCKHVQIGHQTIATFRIAMLGRPILASEIGIQILLFHFFIILYHLIAHEIVYDRF